METSPNEELAQLISSSLVTEGLVLEADKAELLQKLLDGTATINNWQEWASNVWQQEEGNDVDSSKD